jgi:hypothetical protein
MNWMLGATDQILEKAVLPVDRSHPAVARLDDVERRGKQRTTFWQHIGSSLGIGGPPLILDFPTGHL